MSEENLAVVNRHFEAMRKGDMEALADTLADNYVAHRPAPEADIPGKQAQVERFQRGTSGLTLGEMTVKDQVAAGDKVVSFVSYTVTHTGVWSGIPATGKQAVGSLIHVSRVVNGKITEIWRESNDLQILQQLGITTVPEA